MNHSFNVDIASKHGIPEAIMLENLYYWILKNKANSKHFYDGTYWTYNSQQAFTALFPYWNRNQIQRILSNLEKEQLIKKGNYNNSAYDRTSWYSLTNKALQYFEKSNVINNTVDCSKVNNGLCESKQPIPNINTNIKPNINKLEKTHYADNVTLTEEEYSKLINEYGKSLITDKIEDLDLWKGSKGKKTRSDYMTIRQWIKRDVKGGSTNGQYTRNNQQNKGKYSGIKVPECKITDADREAARKLEESGELI